MRASVELALGTRETSVGKERGSHVGFIQNMLEMGEYGVRKRCKKNGNH